MNNATPVPSTPAAPRSLYARLWLNTWRGRFAWFFGGIFLAFLIVWILIRMTPSWYAPLDPADQNVIDLSSRAQSVLLDLRNKTERVPLGEQSWTITQDELNSFLAIQSPRLEGSDIPVSDPCVTFGEGTISLSARIRQIPSSHKQGGVGTLIFSVGTVDVNGKQMGEVKLLGVRAGRLPVPASLLQDRLRNNMPGIISGIEGIISTQLNVKDTSAIQESLRMAGEGSPFPLDFRINKKDVVVKQITVKQGVFSIVFAPPPRPTAVTPSVVAPAPAPVIAPPAAPAPPAGRVTVPATARAAAPTTAPASAPATSPFAVPLQLRYPADAP